MGILNRMRKTKKKKKDQYQRIKHRTLHLFKEISSESVEHIIKDLIELGRDKKRRPITLYISSPGGDCGAGFALIDIMEKCRCPIKTIGVGEICSMAVPILLAGTQGRRYISKRAFIMIHPVSTGASDYLSFAKSRILNAEQVEKMYDDYIMSRSNLPKKILNEAKTKEKWLTAKEAIKYGLVDKEL